MYKSFILKKALTMAPKKTTIQVKFSFPKWNMMILVTIKPTLSLYNLEKYH
jgi:hypothetical protein